MLAFELQRDRLHLDPCLLERYAAFEAGHREDTRVPAAVVWQRRRPWSERDVHVSRLEQLEGRRQDSDDGVRTVVELQRASDRLHIGELAVRERRADDCDPFGAGTVFRVTEAAAALDRRAEKRQQVRRDHLGRDALGIAGTGQRHVGGAKGRHARKRFGARAPVLVVESRHRQGGELRRLLVEDDDGRGVGVGQRRQQDGMKDGKDRSIGADPEREREDGDGRECGASEQRSKREPEILHGSSLHSGLGARGSVAR